MFRRIIFITLLITLLISPRVATAGVEGVKTVKLGSNEYVLEMVDTAKVITVTNEQEYAVELEPLSPRGLSSEKKILEPILEVEKFLGDLKIVKDKINIDNENTAISIRLKLIKDDNIEERFEKKLSQGFNNSLKYEKLGNRKYSLEVTMEQLLYLIDMEEVLCITENTNDSIAFEAMETYYIAEVE